MIDYDATIEKFLKSVDSYLLNVLVHARDKDELEMVQNNIEKFRKVVAGWPATADYGVRHERNIVIDPDPFMGGKNSQDNRAFLAFTRVLAVLEKFYQRRAQGLMYLLEDDKKALLDAIKAWNYRTSTSKFKEFTYPFKSPKSFAVQVKQK